MTGVARRCPWAEKVKMEVFDRPEWCLKAKNVKMEVFDHPGSTSRSQKWSKVNSKWIETLPGPFRTLTDVKNLSKHWPDTADTFWVFIKSSEMSLNCLKKKQVKKSILTLFTHFGKKVTFWESYIPVKFVKFAENGVFLPNFY